MKQSEDVKAFKNELRNLEAYKNRYVKLGGLIDYCYDMLGASVRSADPSRERVNTPPDKEREYRIREEIERHERNRRTTKDHIAYIEGILSLIDEEIRECAINIYAKGKSVDSEAKRVYISHNALLNRINRAIGQALKKGD